MTVLKAILVGISILFGMLLVSGIGAFMGGYSSDKQCTKEEDKVGECNRRNDGMNSLWGWSKIISYGVAVIAIFPGIFLVGIGGIYFDEPARSKFK